MLVYGKDIDETALVREMGAVVAASGAAATSPLLVPALGWNPLIALPLGGLTASAITRMIGDACIRHYGGYGGESKSIRIPVTSPVPAA